MDDTLPALGELLADLESPHVEVRARALRGLERSACLSSLAAVRRVASADPDPSVRFEARRFLASLSERLRPDDFGPAAGSNLPRYRAMLADPEPAVRVKVVRALATAIAPEIPGLLEEALRTERDAFVVATLLQALVAVRSAAAVPLVGPYLTHADPRVRATAVETLEATGDPAVLPLVAPMLQDPHHRVQVAAARAVRRHAPEAVLACVDGMLTSESEVVVRSALYVLRYFDEPIALPRLRAGLTHPARESRQMAARSLEALAARGSQGALGLSEWNALEERSSPDESVSRRERPPVEAQLGERLLSADVTTQVEALLEASRLARTDLLPSVLALLSSGTNPRAVATAASTVGALGTSEHISALAPLLSAADPRVRANAVESIGLLAGAKGHPCVIPALDDANNRVRANAVVALRGCKSVDVLPVLRGMASSPHPRFRMSAVWAAARVVDGPAITILSTLLASDDPDTARRARSALAALAPTVPQAAETLRDATLREQTETVPPMQPAELERLIFDLGHDSREVRLRTLEAAAHVKHPTLLQAVRELLKDDDPTVRRAARASARAMLRGPDSGAASPAALAAFSDGLRGDAPTAGRTLEHALELAVSCGARLVATAIHEALPGESRPFIRASLLSLLGLLGDSSSVPLARAFLRDPDARVRANAIDALELAGNDSDLLATSICLADPEPRVRGAAIRAAMRLSPEVFVGHLQGMLLAPAVAERAAALHVVRTLKLPGTLELLRRHFEQETHPKLLEACADALARLDHPLPPTRASQLLAELPPGDRRSALEAALAAHAPRMAEPSGEQPGASETCDVALNLKELASGPAPVRLADVLPHARAKDRRLRMAAVAVVARIESDDAAELLRELVRDRDSSVAIEALRALAKRSRDAALESLHAMAGPGRPWEVRRALELAESLGDPALAQVALRVLERPPHGSFVEPLERLIVAWGTSETLSELVRAHDSAGPDRKHFIAELIHVLGRKLEIPPTRLHREFPLELPARTAPAAPVARDVLPQAGPAGAPSGLSPILAGIALYVFMMTAALWMFWPEGAAGSVTLRADADLHSAPTLRRRIEFNARAADRNSPRFASASFRDRYREALADNVNPSVSEIEAQLRKELRANGLVSESFLKLLTLDRADAQYQLELDRAAARLERGEIDAALSLMEEALLAVDPEHVLARLAILRALESAARAGRRHAAAADALQRLCVEERKLLDVTLDAAQQAGATAEEIAGMRATFEANQKSKLEASRTGALLTGAKGP